MKNRLLSSLLTLALLLGLCPVWQAPTRAASVGTTDWSSLTSFKSGETYYGNTAQKRCGIKASVVKYRHG